jgi:hypothetical protein
MCPSSSVSEISFPLEEDYTTLEARICQLAAGLPRGFLHKEKCGF